MNLRSHNFGEANVREANVKGGNGRPAGAKIVRVGERL